MGLTNRVRQARELAGLTQIELAAALGNSQSDISQMELGDSEQRQLRTVRQYAKFFNVPIEELFPEPRR